MAKIRIIRRIGSFRRKACMSGCLNKVFILFLFFCFTFARAGDVEFRAQVEQNQISQGETVALNFIIKTQNNTQVDEPEFEAPDFEVVSQFSSISQSFQFSSNPNRSLVENTQQLTKILRPRRQGALKIKNIRLTVEGQAIRAPDLLVQVDPGGSATPGTPPSAPSYPLPQGPRIQGGASRPSDRKALGNRVVLRAEIDKKTAYKGEQLIVSYYLYHQMKVFNLQVEKFPVLGGFLREDLEIPIMTQGLTSEQSELNGEPYGRYLLARYAAYPLQEGKLQIDSISMKYNYYSNINGASPDDDDPFLGFFQQVVPRPGAVQSEPIQVEVVPLPEEGRPESFVGGVGDFTVVSAVDRYEVHANEAVTLKIKVEGRGNVVSIQDPKVKWPDGVELYDSKVRSKINKQGVGEKFFELLLIPRVPGKLTLPSLDFGFFNPAKKSYYVQHTDPIQLNILDALPGSSWVPAQKSQSKAAPDLNPNPSATPVPAELRPLKSSTETSLPFNLDQLGRLLLFASLLVFGVLGTWILGDFFRGLKQKKRNRTHAGARDYGKVLNQLSHSGKNAIKGAPWQEVTEAYENLAEVIFDRLEEFSAAGVRSISRDQLRRILIEEKSVSNELWERISKLLEFSDLVRFASSVGAVSESNARGELSRWVEEGERVIQGLALLS